jgi:hypothetical protein
MGLMGAIRICDCESVGVVELYDVLLEVMRR